MTSSPSPVELEAPSSSMPPYSSLQHGAAHGQRRGGSTAADLRINSSHSHASTPTYSEKDHSRGFYGAYNGNGGGILSSSRARLSLVLLLVLGLAAYLWWHPVHFDSHHHHHDEANFANNNNGDYDANSGLRPDHLNSLASEGVGGANHVQSMRALSLAAMDAGRPAPVGVSFQCPPPQPCPVPLCPDADNAAVSADSAAATPCPPTPVCPKCPKALVAEEQECPPCETKVCPPQLAAKCDAGACSQICAKNSAATGDLDLPPYLAPRLAMMSASSKLLFPAANDLAHQGSSFDLSSHDVTWRYCEKGLGLKEHKAISTKGSDLALCPETAKNEWFWQLSWFERTDAKNKTGGKISRHATVHTPTCAQLPPRGYVFPEKYPALPMTPSPGQPMAKTPAGKVDATDLSHGLFPWQNLRMEKITDLLDFNSATPKNLYHFDAPNYDRQQHHFLEEVAHIIPFEQKVRLMLDVGAGGASLGLLMKRLYDVQTVSTVFADWPYCEYITERGGLCVLLDSMIAFPFAKFSYDAIHTSWIYHGVYPKDLFQVFQEQNRILRPGGYLWWVGGWSREQMKALAGYAAALGYKELYSVVTPVANADKPGAWRFGTKADIPYQVDWTVVWVKPIKAVPGGC